MTTLRVLVIVAIVLTVASPALGFDPEQTFKKGGFVLSVDGGGGSQNDLERHGRQTGIDLWWIQGRASLLPFGTTGKDGFLYGAFEVGLEPVYQKYFGNVDAYFAGLGLAARYHFLSLGVIAPYVELGAAVGGTNLRAIEIDSTFAFRLYGGLGASLFISDNAAIYAGYRMVHVSNGNTSRPNRGFEADTGVLGVSFFFP
jgi:opacity protein-like surface antigen